nr:MAG TPA: hypothetical protein [Caudoviricetes sp.]
MHSRFASWQQDRRKHFLLSRSLKSTVHENHRNNHMYKTEQHWDNYVCTISDLYP